MTAEEVRIYALSLKKTVLQSPSAISQYPVPFIAGTSIILVTVPFMRAGKAVCAAV